MRLWNRICKESWNKCWCAGDAAARIEQLLLGSITSPQEASRLCAVQWANRLFPFQHVPARYICALAAGDIKLEVREEGQSGLKPPKPQPGNFSATIEHRYKVTISSAISAFFLGAVNADGCANCNGSGDCRCSTDEGDIPTAGSNGVIHSEQAASPAAGSSNSQRLPGQEQAIATATQSLFGSHRLPEGVQAAAHG